MRSSSWCSGASPLRNFCRSFLRDPPPWASEPELWPLTCWSILLQCGQPGFWVTGTSSAIHPVMGAQAGTWVQQKARFSRERFANLGYYDDASVPSQSSQIRAVFSSSPSSRFPPASRLPARNFWKGCDHGPTARAAARAAPPGPTEKAGGRAGWESRREEEGAGASREGREAGTAGAHRPATRSRRVARSPAAPPPGRGAHGARGARGPLWTPGGSEGLQLGQSTRGTWAERDEAPASRVPAREAREPRPHGAPSLGRGRRGEHWAGPSDPATLRDSSRAREWR